MESPRWLNQGLLRVLKKLECVNNHGFLRTYLAQSYWIKEKKGSKGITWEVPVDLIRRRILCLKRSQLRSLVLLP